MTAVIVLATLASLMYTVAAINILGERRIERHEFAAEIDAMLPRIDGGAR